MKRAARTMRRSAALLLACMAAWCAAGRSARSEGDEFSAGDLPPAVLPHAEKYNGACEAPALSSTNGAVFIVLDVRESILMALNRNTAFRVERMQPRIMETYEREARAEFDPTLFGDLYYADIGGATNDIAAHNSFGAGVAVRQALPTGTALEAGANRAPADERTPSSESYDVRITQSLLRGFGTDVNLARLRQSRIDTQISAYELRGLAESLVARVESVYWDCILAERAIAIYEKSVEIAEQEISEAKERIRLGNLAETELAAVEAELASRRENLIDARSGFAKSRLALLHLISPGGEDAFSARIALTQSPELAAPVALDDVGAHVQLGLKQRADLNQARLAIARGEIELVRTRNGMLPKLDFFIRLGGTRYSESFSSYDADEWSREAAAGLALEYPVVNRAERASRDRALLSLEQARDALMNMRSLIEVEIRTAYLEVDRAEEQVKAKEATRKLRSETLQAEMEKLRVGRSTSLLVAQASRDLVESEIACMRSVIARRKALLDLYRAEGSLLDRRGIGSGEGEVYEDRSS